MTSLFEPMIKKFRYTEKATKSGPSSAVWFYKKLCDFFATEALFSGFLNLKKKQDLKIAQNLSTVSYEYVSNKTICTECI